MTTAREQAREAAWSVFLNADPTLPTAKAMVEAEADAASDVWEAREERTLAVLRATVDLLRETYEMLRDSTPGPLPEDAPVRDVLRRAKEALTDE